MKRSSIVLPIALLFASYTTSVLCMNKEYTKYVTSYVTSVLSINKVNNQKKLTNENIKTLLEENEGYIPKGEEELYKKYLSMLRIDENGKFRIKIEDEIKDTRLLSMILAGMCYGTPNACWSTEHAFLKILDPENAKNSFSPNCTLYWRAENTPKKFLLGSNLLGYQLNVEQLKEDYPKNKTLLNAFSKLENALKPNPYNKQ